MTHQLIKRGLLQAFDPLTYTATVMILEATYLTLTNVPIATGVDGTSAIPGAMCAVLFFDEQNNDDAVILALYSRVPTQTPGRVVLVTAYQQLNGVTINANTTNTYTLTGVGGIPSGALGVIYKVFYSSTTNGAFLQMAPHSNTIGNYASVGNITVSGSTINGNGIVGLDANGQLDIKANVGNCVVTLYTHGYVF
jgi:hypothetical protein